MSRRRTVLVAALGVAMAMATAGVATVATGWAGSPAGAGQAGQDDAGASSTATAPVTRTDLASTEQVDGALGFRDLGAKVVNQLPGTLTSLAGEGTVVERGHTLYEVDARPVKLLYGNRPAWRRLGPGVSDGADVRQLEENLVALGFGRRGLKVDDTFSEATAEAVKRWQKSFGAEQTGAVEHGEVVFLPGAVRVAAHKVAAGGPAAPGAEVLEGTSTARVVTVDLDAGKQAVVKAGDAVTVTLPSGARTAGTVTDVGRVAKKSDSGGNSAGGGDDTGGGAGDSGKTTVKVSVELADASLAGDLDQAPVRVSITTRSAKGVLAVPVNALLALAEGGYAVEVEERGRRRLLPVTTGLFDEGTSLVEVTGPGLAEGMRVVVPR